MKDLCGLMRGVCVCGGIYGSPFTWTGRLITAFQHIL